MSNQMPLVGNVMSNSLSAEKEKGKEKTFRKIINSTKII